MSHRLVFGSLPATLALVYALSSSFSNSVSGDNLQKFFSNYITLALSTYSWRIKVHRTQPKKKIPFWFITQALSSNSLNDTSRAGQSLTNFRSQEHTHLSVQVSCRVCFQADKKDNVFIYLHILKTCRQHTGIQSINFSQPMLNASSPPTTSTCKSNH